MVLKEKPSSRRCFQSSGDTWLRNDSHEHEHGNDPDRAGRLVSSNFTKATIEVEHDGKILQVETELLGGDVTLKRGSLYMFIGELVQQPVGPRLPTSYLFHTTAIPSFSLPFSPHPLRWMIPPHSYPLPACQLTETRNMM